MVKTNNQKKDKDEISIIQSIKKNLSVDDDGTIHVAKDDLHKGFLYFIQAIEDLDLHFKGIVKFRVKDQETENTESFIKKFRHVDLSISDYCIKEISDSDGIFQMNVKKSYSSELGKYFKVKKNSAIVSDCETHLINKSYKYCVDSETHLDFGGLPLNLDKLDDALQKTGCQIIPGVTKSFFYHGSNGSFFPLVKKLALFGLNFTTHLILSSC
jgi:hypothetical protein